MKQITPKMQWLQTAFREFRGSRGRELGRARAGGSGGPQASAARGAGPTRGAPGPRGFALAFPAPLPAGLARASRSAAARAGAAGHARAPVDAATLLKQRPRRLGTLSAPLPLATSPGHCTHPRQGEPRRPPNRELQSAGGACVRGAVTLAISGNAVCHTWIVNQAVQGQLSSVWRNAGNPASRGKFSCI